VDKVDKGKILLCVHLAAIQEAQNVHPQKFQGGHLEHRKPDY
jgi:hypothetical protein